MQGSSPHARGTQSRLPLPQGANGIIPACAGNTPATIFLPRCRGDHPRMRGEHTCTLWPSKTVEGSSPHARGTRVLVPTAPVPVGIIPACAGNTPCSRISGSCTGDHPRMRGEHCEGLASGVGCEGSSPHARGTRHRNRKRKLLGGIIPACAGNTQGHF